MYAQDPFDLLTLNKLDKPPFSGPCKYHPQYNNGEELIIERYAAGSLGYFVCEGCKRARRKERELTYVRRNGKPLRTHAWDMVTKRFIPR